MLKQNPDDLLQPSDVSYLAAKAGDPISAAMVRQHADAGRLPHLRTASGLRLFRRADAVHFLAERREARDHD